MTIDAMPGALPYHQLTMHDGRRPGTDESTLDTNNTGQQGY